MCRADLHVCLHVPCLLNDQSACLYTGLLNDMLLCLRVHVFAHAAHLLAQACTTIRRMTRRGFSKENLCASIATKSSPCWPRRTTKEGQRFPPSRRIGSLYNTTGCAGDFYAHPLHCLASPGAKSGLVEESTGGMGGSGMNIKQL